MVEIKNLKANIRLSSDSRILLCSGDWTVSQIAGLKSQWSFVLNHLGETVRVDVSRIAVADSTGALFFQNIIEELKALDKSPALAGINEQFQTMLDLVALQHQVIHRQALKQLAVPPFLYRLGEWVLFKCQVGFELLRFVGELFVRSVDTVRRLRYAHWPLVLRVINDAGCAGLPIVALLTFLVGIILTYQIAIQLTAYNVNVIIVDITGIVILREFGPLITAIIAAGRTSTAFTSEIGTMMVNEEVDALRTMGVSPIQRLVLPKLLGVLIVFPLLTVWADIFGIFGSMLMSHYEMDVSYRLYLERFQDVVSVRHLLVGLIKAPMFALIIVTVGCFQGFSVKKTAESVGRNTMQSAVQSIFLIIIVDALFSVFSSWQLVSA